MHYLKAVSLVKPSSKCFIPNKVGQAQLERLWMEQKSTILVTDIQLSSAL